MRLPYEEYRQFDLPKPERVFTGLDGYIHGLIGRFQRGKGQIAQLRQQADKVCEDSLKLAELSDTELKARISQQADIQRRDTDADLLNALPLVVEAAFRTTGMRAYPEQVMGALGVAGGFLIEMETGSGKSLTAAIAAVPMGWSGRPCHLITVNDYLAQRDAKEFAALYKYCGVDVGAVTGEMEEAERQAGYACGVTYTTSKQLLADFLRDRLIIGEVRSGAQYSMRASLRGGQHSAPVMRGLDQAILDEADSVLIDEAVSPLQIQAEREAEFLDETVKTAGVLSQQLEQGTDYKLDLSARQVVFTDQGRNRMRELASHLPPLWRARDRREQLMRQAISARAFYRRDEHYVIQDDKIVIVDEFTGRLMPQRNWGQGMHQAVEAKEGVPLSPAREVKARMSFQRFFRLFRRLGGMTGTAEEATGEFWRIYQLPVIPIPSHWPSTRTGLDACVCANAEEKWTAIEEEVFDVHRTGRPVLIGTRSIHDSELLAERLRSRKLKADLLNALYHEQEAEIVAEAGQVGRITIATNMAGRGTDIKLAAGVSELGGLHVIVSEPHESGRIDRQLIGRCARHDDPGSYRVYIAQDDPLLRRFLPKALQRFSAMSLQWGATVAQRRAEAVAAKVRRRVLERDTKQSDALLFASRIGEY